MNIERTVLLSALNEADMLIVGHPSWDEALVLERVDGYIHHPSLKDGIWTYPIAKQDRPIIERANSWDIPAGDWGILYGASNNDGPVETWDGCPNVHLKIIDRKDEEEE